jgi:hypothetical protein
VLVGLCGFGLAADGGYSTIFADGGATIVSDVARVVGPLVGSEGVSGAVDSCGVVPEGACSFVWAVDGGFSSVCAGGGGVINGDVAVRVLLLGGSRGGWDASRGVVNELGGTETRCGDAVRCSGVVGVGRMVVVVADIVVDGCDVAVDTCDIGCDEGVGGEVSVGKTEGMDLGVDWNEVGVGILGVVAFFGQFASKASEKIPQDSFFSSGRVLHHRSASEQDFRCSSKAWSLSASVTSAPLGRSHCSILCKKSRGSSCS